VAAKDKFLIEALVNDIDHPWRWRSHDGTFRTPAEMKSGHLFHTLRMIWNNVAPVEARVGRVRLYNFGPFYTADYMKMAVRRIYPELLTRKDLTPAQEAELEAMRSWFGADYTIVESIPAPQKRLPGAKL
jgi:hypothetical protein